MDSYKPWPLAPERGARVPDAREPLNEAGDFLRRLIPFPGSQELSALPLLASPAQGGAVQPNPAAKAMPDIVGEQAASIVSQAASILDEEMARGVLAARRSVGPAPQYSQPSNPLLRQVHDFVDNIAAIWPNLPGAQGAGSFRPAANAADPLAEVRPRTTVRPGQRATISMTLCNSESRPVRLVAAVTDLLGSRGGRIASSLLELAPPDLSLEPQEKRDVSITTIVPLDAAPGCYSGLLVVTGVDYLRALITIEVE